MMKFVVCILAICCLGLSYGTQYSTFGMRKSYQVVLKEFAESFNKIIGGIGYIQFYDVSKKVSIFPIAPELILSSIEMSNLKIVKPLAQKDLVYEFNSTKATIKTNAKIDLALGADFNLKWVYKYDGSVIYSGVYSAKLATTNVSVSFDLINESPNSNGKITLGWGISNPVIKGFGTNDLMITHINGLIVEKLYPVFQEELNRFNDILVSSMVYNYFFRRIPIGIITPQKDEVSIKNVHKKFLLDKDYVSFVYGCSLYFSVQHIEAPLDFPFTPAESDSNVTTFFGYNASSFIYDMVVKTSPFTHIEITEKDQEKLLGYPMTIAKLAEFYPKLAEDYELTKKADLVCDLLGGLGKDKTYLYKCVIQLAAAPRDILFDFKQIHWTADFLVSSKDGKNMKWGMNNFRFPAITLKSPRLNEATKAEFLDFLQPLAKFPEGQNEFTVAILGNNINWSFKSTSPAENPDLSINYDA